MAEVIAHLLTADLGGTHANVALFAHGGGDRFELVRHKSYVSREITDFPSLLAEFLKREGSGLKPPAGRACIDFAGPVDPERSNAFPTNLSWGFTAAEVQERTRLDRVVLLNDFEAVGYGLEILAANKPEAFVRLSSAGELPPRTGRKLPAVVIGAGTGLGTSILVENPRNGRYRPLPGEGGHADFAATEELEFQVARWIRDNRNHSRLNPADCEKVVSGPGIASIYQALWELKRGAADPSVFARVSAADIFDRPAIIAQNAHGDELCRRTMDFWVRCYARAAKNCALFPLAPGGVFLAGGIAAKVLPEFQTGLFMEEFTRCDVPGIRTILERTPVFVITDYSIGLYGCAGVAVNPEQLN